MLGVRHFVFLLALTLHAVFAFAAEPTVHPDHPGVLTGWTDSRAICAGRFAGLKRWLRPPVLDPRYGVTLDPQPLGEGGMGRVWRGTGVDTHGKPRYLIVKEALEDPNDLQATLTNQKHLRNEYKVLRELYGEDVFLVETNGKPYVVMQLFARDPKAPETPAPSLEDALYGGKRRIPAFAERGDTRDPKAIDEVTESLLDGLIYLHAKDMIHGDIKPGNILIGLNTKGRPVARLIDFGLVRNQTYNQQKKAWGTPLYNYNRENLTGNGVTPERDVRSLQRTLLALHLRDRMHVALYGGVTRELGDRTWHDPVRVFDTVSEIAPETALVLQSEVPTNATELKQMLAEAKDPKTFPKKFADRWLVAYQNTLQPHLKSEMIYELAMASNIGPRVLEHLPKKIQAEIVAEAMFRKEWAELKAKTGDPNPLFGWHYGVGPTLTEFLAHPSVKPIAAMTPKQKLELFEGSIADLGKNQEVMGTQYMVSKMLYILHTADPKALEGKFSSLIAPLAALTDSSIGAVAPASAKSDIPIVLKNLGEHPSLPVLVSDKAGAEGAIALLEAANGLPDKYRPRDADVVFVMGTIVLNYESNIGADVPKAERREKYKVALRAAEAAEVHFLAKGDDKGAKSFHEAAQRLRGRIAP